MAGGSLDQVGTGQEAAPAISVYWPLLLVLLWALPVLDSIQANVKSRQTPIL